MIAGKIIYIWDIDSICNGDVNAITAMLKLTGFEGAILHNARLDTWRTTKRTALIKALREAGIEPIGGAAVYGSDPVKEGQQAAEICDWYDLATFVFDAESKFDAQPKADTNAVKLLHAFRVKVPNVKSAWCWWARWKSPLTSIQWHPKKVLWAAMAKNYGDADYGLPMAYWGGNSAKNATLLLDQTFKQWRELTDKPIIPIGRAYSGDGGTAIPEAVTAFDAHARALGAAGVAWWSMQHAIPIPGIWDALAKTAKFHEVIPPVFTPVLTLEDRIARLETAVFGKPN